MAEKKDTDKKPTNKELVAANTVGLVAPRSIADDAYKRAFDMYIATNEPLTDIAEKCGIKYRTLYTCAKREQWAEYRSASRVITVRKTINRFTSHEAEKLRNLMNGIDLLNKSVYEAIADVRQPYMYFDKNGKVVRREKVNTEYLLDMAELIKRLTEVTSELYGILTEKDAQKLELERDKISAKLKAAEVADDDAGAGVIILPPMDEESQGKSEE